MSIDNLYPHQQEALHRLSDGKILWGGVGSGKSRVAAAYYMKEEQPRDIVVITTAKKRDSLDWESEIVKYGVYKSRDATVTGGILIVESWNNIEKWAGVRNAFFIFDEQRLVGSGAWTKAFLKIAKNNRWILLSATPGDTWLDYIPVFLANGFYKNRTEFLREHVIFSRYAKFPKVERFIGEGKLRRLRDQLLVEMPYLSHTTRICKDVPVEFDCSLFERVLKKRWHVYESRPLRDVAELFLVMRKVVNSNSSRILAIRRLMDVHPKLIVFYNFDYELESLRTLRGSALSTGDKKWNDRENPAKQNRQSGKEATGLSSGRSTVIAGGRGSTSEIQQAQESFAVAEWNGHKHEEIPDTDRWVYLVQYVAGAEGWECIDTDVMVFYSLTYSYKNFHQAHGRIDRLNTPFKELYYYTLMSNSVIDKAVAKSLKSKKNFNERGFLKGKLQM